MTFRQLALALVMMTAAGTAAPLPMGFAAPAPFETLAPLTPTQQAMLPDPFQALLTKVVKKVEWQRFRTVVWQRAALDNVLMVGDTLRTGADAKAELLYGDGSVTRVGSLTSLTLTGENKRELHLDGGRVWLHIRKGGAGMKVITPGAVAAVTGTELMVEFDPVRKLTEVTVFEGAVNVTGDVGNLVKVLGGTTTRVPFRAPAAAPLPLDNRKLEERSTILRPLSLPAEPDEGQTGQTDPNGQTPTNPPATAGPTVQATTGPATTTNNDPNATGNPATTGSNQTATDPAAVEAKPVSPDLKGQTEKLLDPRIINGSPTTGQLRVIIK